MEVEKTSVMEEIDQSSVITDESRHDESIGGIESYPEHIQRIMDDAGRLAMKYGANGQEEPLQRELTLRLSQLADLPVNNIQISPNRNQAIEAIMKAFCQPGETILMSGSSENDIGAVADRCGVRILHHFGPTPFAADPEGIIAGLSAEVKLVYLNNPDYITGALYSQHEIELVLQGLNGAILILDESYCCYPGGSLAKLIENYNNLAVIRTFSIAPDPNSMPPGLILACPGIMEKLTAYYTNGMMTISGLAAASVELNNLDYLRQYNEMIQENMLCLSTKLRGLGIPSRLSPSNFILIKVTRPVKVISCLNRKGIAAQDVGRFERMDGYLKIVIADSTISERILAAFEEMPAQYYFIRRIGQTRIVIRRKAEEISRARKSNIDEASFKL